MEPDWNAVARASLDKWDAVAACSSSLRAAYTLGKRAPQEWLPIADAPRGGYHKPVRLWADGYPLWSAGFWLPIPMAWASFAGLRTLDPQPTHFQHLSPPPENTP